MIVKDEEPVIGRCLSIVTQFADETIVVDTGSRDKTKEIAKRYTENVFDYPWEDDFAKARNESYRRATCDYVMWMDADDVIRPDGIQRLRSLMCDLKDPIDVIFLPYFEREKGRPEVFDSYLMRDRILRRDLQPVWENPIHEAIAIPQNWRPLFCRDIPVYHEKLVVNEEGRNMRIFVKSMAEGWQLDDYSKAYYCRELSLSHKYEEAIRVFHSLFETRSEEHNVYYALIYYIDAMEQVKRYAELKKTLLAYINEYRITEMVCCELGRCCLKGNQLSEAYSWYQKATEVPIDDADLELHCRAWSTVIPWVQMAKIHLHQRQYAQAQYYLDQAKGLAADWKMVQLLQLMLNYHKQLSQKTD